MSQIGAQHHHHQKGGPNSTVVNSSSEGYLVKQSQQQVTHQTHLSSISGINAGLNASSHTIPSPLLKFTNQKGIDCSNSSLQN